MPIPDFHSVNMLPTGSHDYDIFPAEYVAADPNTRLDILTFTNEVDGILFYADDSIATLTFLECTCTTEENS